MNRSPFILLSLMGLLGAAPATQPLPPVTITRSDFTRALLRFEEAYAIHHPAAGAERAAIHRAFDEVTLLQLSSRLGEVVQKLEELTDQLDPAPASSPIRSLLRSLQVRIAPPVAWRTRPGILRIRVARMYPVDATLPVELHLVIRPDAPDSKPIFDVPVKIEGQGPPFMLTQEGLEAPMGRYRVELVALDSSRLLASYWTIVEMSLDTIRLSNAVLTQGLRPDTPEMIQALVACNARNALLSDRPDENNPAQYLANGLELARQVQSEAGWISTGRNPYINRVGDWWRVIQAGTMQVPARAYAPPQVQLGQPMPLIICLQGGGGDESIFMDAIGHGRIKHLADRDGFIVIAPNSFWLKNNLAAFNGIIEAMGTIYSIDKSRIYLIGHSTGAAVAAQMAARDADKIAAMALISGGDFADVRRLPRTLLYSGGIDPFFSPAKAAALVDQAKQSHLPVEHRSVKDAGHMLLLDDVLDEAVGWLMGVLQR